MVAPETVHGPALRTNPRQPHPPPHRSPPITADSDRRCRPQPARHPVIGNMERCATQCRRRRNRVWDPGLRALGTTPARHSGRELGLAGFAPHIARCRSALEHRKRPGNAQPSPVRRGRRHIARFDGLLGRIDSRPPEVDAAESNMVRLHRYLCAIRESARIRCLWTLN